MPRFHIYIHICVKCNCLCHASNLSGLRHIFLDSLSFFAVCYTYPRVTQTVRHQIRCKKFEIENFCGFHKSFSIKRQRELKLKADCLQYLFCSDGTKHRQLGAHVCAFLCLTCVCCGTWICFVVYMHFVFTICSAIAIRMWDMLKVPGLATICNAKLAICHCRLCNLEASSSQ